MPPQISSDESSDVEMNNTKKGKGKAKPQPKIEEEKLKVESGDEEAEDEDLGEDEFVVEKILRHMFDDETGGLKFEVKWEGYEKKSDRTWEPEENLIDSAHLILSNYLDSIGGRDAILEDYNEKKAEIIAKKKRGRASAGTPQGNGAKKSKKNGTHPASATPPASVEKADFKPPSGNWEDEVVGIDACEGGEGKVVVYLTWKNGQKSQHPLQQVYKRCPQKMLKFYESHLVFKQTNPLQE